MDQGHYISSTLELSNTPTGLYFIPERSGLSQHNSLSLHQPRGVRGHARHVDGKWVGRCNKVGRVYKWDVYCVVE
jgi:hypothetical protein